MKTKKINLDVVVIYYVQINLFLLVEFLVIFMALDIMVEMVKLVSNKCIKLLLELISHIVL